MPKLLLVMIGGAVGAGLRYEAGRFALARLGPGFPWGTLIVNLAGGLFAGLLLGLGVRLGISEQLMLLLGVGLLGGFTTFSAFSGDIARLIEQGSLGLAAAYAAASVAGSVLLLFAGLWLTRASA